VARRKEVVMTRKMDDLGDIAERLQKFSAKSDRSFRRDFKGEDPPSREEIDLVIKYITWKGWVIVAPDGPKPAVSAARFNELLTENDKLKSYIKGLGLAGPGNLKVSPQKPMNVAEEIAARVQELEDELRELRDDPTIGKEAEELRKGIEKIIETWSAVNVEEAEDLRKDLQELLDNVDARDSLHYLAKEANKKADQRVEVKMPKVTCSPVYAAPMDFDEPMEVSPQKPKAILDKCFCNNCKKVLDGKFYTQCPNCNSDDVSPPLYTSSPQKPLDKLVQKALNFIKAYRAPGNYSDLVANGKGPMWDALVNLDSAVKEYEAERKKQESKPSCPGQLNNTLCALPWGHDGPHQDDTGALKWPNEDEPIEKQGFFCWEEKPGEKKQESNPDGWKVQATATAVLDTAVKVGRLLESAEPLHYNRHEGDRERDVSDELHEKLESLQLAVGEYEASRRGRIIDDAQKSIAKSCSNCGRPKDKPDHELAPCGLPCTNFDLWEPEGDKPEPVSTCGKCGGTGRVAINIRGGSSVGEGPCFCAAGQKWAHERCREPQEVEEEIHVLDSRHVTKQMRKCLKGEHEPHEDGLWINMQVYVKRKHGPDDLQWREYTTCRHCGAVYMNPERSMKRDETHVEVIDRTPAGHPEDGPKVPSDKATSWLVWRRGHESDTELVKAQGWYNARNEGELHFRRKYPDLDIGEIIIEGKEVEDEAHL
jgi:hypothetical protein